MNNQQFRNVTYLSDRSGTAKWRKIWPLQLIDCIAQSASIQSDYSQTPILDQNYYRGMNSICVQRWITDQQKNLFCGLFKPMMDNNHGWLFYEIDDAMHYNSIPVFNRGRKAFEGDKIQANIKDMLNAADFVTVTTDYIKQYYHDKYGVPMENIIALPNLLPRYLFGNLYDATKKTKAFGKMKGKPRVGIVSSLSHFNVDDVHVDKSGKACRKERQPDGTFKWFNEDHVEVPEAETTKITDDFDEIADMVRETINDFQWVCFGYCPPQIKDLADAGKIEVHGGVPIMNYPASIANLQLQAIVAPIKRMEFNFCKSFIKYMECAAIGVPCYATNCLPYSRIMPKEQLFDDGNDLKEKLMKLKMSSTENYKSIIEAQWKWLNSPTHEGDFDIKNFWMEDNVDIYVNMNRLRQKGLTISFNMFVDQYEKRKAEEAKSIIYKNDNGVEILK